MFGSAKAIGSVTTILMPLQGNSDDDDQPRAKALGSHPVLLSELNAPSGSRTLSAPSRRIAPAPSHLLSVRPRSRSIPAIPAFSCRR
jgi:hypothetical protein